MRLEYSSGFELLQLCVSESGITPDEMEQMVAYAHKHPAFMKWMREHQLHLLSLYAEEY